MSEPYVMMEIQNQIDAFNMDDNVKLMKNRIVTSLLRDALSTGVGTSQKGRVTAATQMTKLLGMEPDKDTNVNVAVSGVMAVPGIANIADWENQAAGSQQQLVQDTNNDPNDKRTS